jgi:hypothetical protein
MVRDLGTNEKNLGNVFGHFLLVLGNFQIFENHYFDQILVEPRKVDILLKNPCHFSEKKNHKKQENILNFQN